MQLAICKIYSLTNYLTLWRWIFLVKLLAPSLSTNSSHFMEPEYPLSYFQELATSSYPKLHQSIHRFPILCLRFTLIISSHLHLGVYGGLFPFSLVHSISSEDIVHFCAEIRKLLLVQFRRRLVQTEQCCVGGSSSLNKHARGVRGCLS